MQLPDGFDTLTQYTPDEHDIIVKIVEVTPEAAEKWLLYNHHHREIRAKKVDEYAATMRSDQWVVNGKTIVFDYNGKLVGGQHRLSACVASGCPFLALIVLGVDPGVAVVAEKPAKKRGKQLAEAV